MNIYLIWADTQGYDTYDQAVVIAATANDAKRTHPNNLKKVGEGHDMGDWPTTIKKIHAKKIGESNEAMKPGVVCASFNAG